MPTDFEKRQAILLKDVEGKLHHFRRLAKAARFALRISQFASLTITGGAPLLILIELGSKELHAVLIFVAGLATAFPGIFSWRQSWLNHASTRNEIGAELTAFKSRTGEYSGVFEDSALDRLSSSVAAIVRADQANWVKRLEAEASKSLTH